MKWIEVIPIRWQLSAITFYCAIVKTLSKNKSKEPLMFDANKQIISHMRCVPLISRWQPYPQPPNALCVAHSALFRFTSMVSPSNWSCFSTSAISTTHWMIHFYYLYKPSFSLCNSGFLALTAFWHGVKGMRKISQHPERASSTTTTKKQSIRHSLFGIELPKLK